MWQCMDMCQIFFWQIHKFHGDDLAFFDQSDQFFFCSQCDIFAFVHDGDSCADLFDFLHIMGSVDDCRAFTVELHDAFKDFVAALWIDCYGRLVENDKLWPVCNAAGDV